METAAPLDRREQLDIININRRNGKPRSCEPCRKIKTRCDHRIPVCGRCQAKAIAHECYYHPAPLTQSNKSRIKVSGSSLHSSSFQTPNTTNSSLERHAAVASSIIFTANALHGNDPPTPTTPSSTPELISPASLIDTIVRPHSAFSDPLSPETPSANLTGPGVEIQLKEVLSHLSELDLISKLIRRWYEISQTCLFPGVFLHEALASLRLAARRFNQDFLEAGRLAADILSATSKPFSVPADTQPSDFPKLFTGSNMRLEIIGLLLSTAGLAALQIPATDTLFLTVKFTKADRNTFATNMLSASDTCISLCDKYFNVNDVMVWLRSENLTLAMNFWGNTSRRTWHRSGELFNDVFALHFHREPEDASQRPMFLDEIRARVFASAYWIDKSLSNALGRPPRLPLHYCNRRLPLHLHDEQLMASEQTRRAAIDSLEKDGWSREVDFHTTAWLRARSMFSIFREEILHIQVGVRNADSKAVFVLGQISQRVHNSWDGIPGYLHYDASCWNSNPSSSICFMLLVLHLEYLDLIFHIEKLLHIVTNRDDTGLLVAATSLLSTTVNSSRQLLIKSGAYTDYVWTVRNCEYSGVFSSLVILTCAQLLFYGLPSAMILAAALKRSAELGQKTMRPMPWSELYRQLSALASDLDGIVQSDEGNYPLCKRGSKLLSDTLDQALNARMSTAPATRSPVSTPPAAFNNAEDFSGNGDMDMMNAFDEIMSRTTFDESTLGDSMDGFGADHIAFLDFNSFGT